MLLILLCIQAVVQVPVLSEVMLEPPQNIHFDEQLLIWTPATEERNVTYTAEYRRFGTSEWKDIQTCTQKSFSSCIINFSKPEHVHECVMLRVRAERGGLTSRPVKACSRHGSLCTPEVSLTARPGSLTVYLSRNHGLAVEHEDHVKHRVYYGKEGESQQKYKDAASSVSIHELEEGQRYCTKVQYIHYNKPVGPESCTQCEVIPKTRHEPKQTVVIVAVLVIVALVILMYAIAYILIVQCGRIKQWLQPPCEIPDHFLLEPFPEHQVCSSSGSPSEGHLDVISSIS
ncbi:interferon gamma receptor 2 [Xiphias gladius]|uniref:interferon gamma receptor 2 n=1 Tax=Xiphias gladius TaxID=8245 RepID=UPI001A997816|nr:interferon gamma receptor 2 [Xiphias gladius]